MSSSSASVRESSSVAVEMSAPAGAGGGAPTSPATQESVAAWLGRSAPAGADTNSLSAKLVAGGFRVEHSHKWAALSPEFLRDSLALTPAETAYARHALSRIRCGCNCTCARQVGGKSVAQLLTRAVTLAAIALSIFFLFRQLDDAEESASKAVGLADSALAQSFSLSAEVTRVKDDVESPCCFRSRRPCLVLATKPRS